MANYRSYKAEDLTVSLGEARGNIRAEYMDYLSGRDVDLANVEAQNSAVIDITKALLSKRVVLSEEEQAINLETIRLCREMRGLQPLIELGSGGSAHSSSSVPVTTPKERIPRFSGEFMDYARFKLVFDALVDRNAQLDDHAKERLLVEHLDGKAAKLISPFIGTQEAYKQMRKLLEKEFEHDRQLKNHLKAELEKLPKINDRYDDRMHEFRDVVNWVAGAARRSPVISEDFQHTLQTMVVGKFSEKIVCEIARQSFDLDGILELFERWRKEKENMLAYGVLKSQSGRDKDQHSDKRNPFRRAAAGQTGRSCYFCRGEHYTDKCNEPPEPRKCKEIVAERRLCFVCLRKGHLASDQSCPRFGVKCRSCQRGKHHQLLCVTTEQRGDTASSCDDPPRDPSTPATPLCAVGVVSNISRYVAGAGNIGTAIINGPPEHYYLGAELNGERIRILLDSGSDVSLIERRLVDDPAHLFRGPKQLVSGLGGTEATTEMCKLQLAGDGVPPIGLGCYVMNELPGVDIIIGRYEMPLLLKNETLDHGRLYFDTVFGRVYVSDRNEAKARMAKCYRAALIDELPMQPLMTELVGKETDPEIPLEVEQRANGRFCARLPFLPGRKPANNFWTAKHRQERLQQRLERMGIKDIYRDKLLEYVVNGHAIPVPDLKCPWTDDAFYLPHREVIRESSVSTPMRIVFDASAGNPSLNDRLFKGNAEQLNLFASLMRFRCRPVAVIADISKAFLQIEVAEDQQSYLRFLWLDGDDLHVYQMCRLPFGLVTSPAILIKAINQLIDSHADVFPWATDLLRRAFYMDDLTVSVNTPAEAERLKIEAQRIFASAGFELAKWNTSDSELQSNWNGKQDKDILKVLGVQWCPESDTLSVKCPAASDLSSITPRKMMQFIGGIFDVIGLVEPVKLHLKNIMRNVIVQKVKWDDDVPESFASDFRNNVESFGRLSTISAPRHVPSPAMVSIFADASDIGLGYVIYFTDDQHRNFFVSGKSKLAPLQKRTIPELELAAVTMAVEQIPFLSEFYDLANVPIIVWTDSAITLHRLASNLNRHGSYVCNRLVRIHRICELHPVQFRHVPTKCNPADHYSRPKSVTRFMKLETVNLRVNLNELLERAEEIELPSVNIACPAKAEGETLVELPGFERYSEWGKMVKAAYHLILGCNRILKSPLEVTVQQALTYLFRMVQQQERTQLGLPHEKDERGIIRVRTRASNDRPIWIPGNSRVAVLIVRHCHAKTAHHMRRRVTKAIINERFYIPRVNRLIDRVLRTCVTCQKQRLKRMTQPTGDLPRFRLQDFLPFECIGLDYFGPIAITARNKVWVLIVTCSVSRAIHLEVVNDQTSNACLAALNCVFNYRGLPKIVVSDNGTNFSATERDLKRLRLILRDRKNDIPEIDIKWHFNLPRASWWGGWFERMIGVVKSVLHKMAHPKTVEVLRYQLAEAMSIINSRPLFSTDSEKDTFVTPGHYLIGRSFKSIPSGPRRLNSFGTLNQLKLIRKRFVRLWHSEYLRALGTHHQHHNRTDVKVGDMVLLPDRNEEKWTLARIESIDSGPDGLVRHVMVLLPDTSTTGSNPRATRGTLRKILPRAVQTLVRLEIDADGGGESVKEIFNASRSLRTSDMTMNVSTLGRSVPMSMNE